MTATDPSQLYVDFAARASHAGAGKGPRRLVAWQKCNEFNGLAGSLDFLQPLRASVVAESKPSRSAASNPSITAKYCGVVGNQDQIDAALGGRPRWRPLACMGGHAD